MSGRQCGGCTLCCRLLPVAEIGKLAGHRCQHQRHAKGCAVYAHAPVSCRAWSCAWLVDEDAGALSRPDRAHYVIDIVPDFVKMVWPDGRVDKLPVLQVWCDPAFPNAHRDPALRAYLSAGSSATTATPASSSCRPRSPGSTIGSRAPGSRSTSIPAPRLWRSPAP